MTGEEAKPAPPSRDQDGIPLPSGVPSWLPPFIYVFVAIACAALLVVHTFWGSETPTTVDTTSLGLLALLLILPLAPYVTKLRAGELEAQIGRAEARDLRQAAGELPPPEREQDGAALGDELGVVELTERDPPLGLAKLRMDLEREVRRIYQQRVRKPATRGLSLGMMIRELVRDDVLPPEISAPLQDVTGLANRAIHGEYVQREAAEEIAEVGVRVVEALRELENETAGTGERLDVNQNR
ncbi:MAG: hypothetical protein JST08_00305 [Actinobacteria bacterium]|nr:hypothetical protein [Actinomycetota bacterium]